ncbi:MAG TPA: MG2 domain-containing protein [Kofleriaceae bacterium]|nr:MG2 domain-containing protein [Kofleriaceae bacterium]
MGFAGLGSCGGPTHGHDLVVTSYSPQAEADDASAIAVKFNRPVVSDQEVGKPVAPGTVTISPAVGWNGHWEDRQTLIVEPSAPLAASTKYTVSLAGALASDTGGFSFSFVNKPLAIEGVFGVDVDAVPLEAELSIGFNQKVLGSDAAAHCTLTDPDGAAIALQSSSPASADTTIKVRPATALVPDRDYTVGCTGLAGAGGDTPMPVAYEKTIHSRPNLFVVGAKPDGNDVAADEVTIDIQLSTPVALDAIRAAVSAKPAIPGMDQGALDDTGKHYRVTADLETDTEYAIKIDALTDAAGQKLTAPFEQHFTTGDARPRISMERGIYALEASAKGYPVWSRNVKKYQVECAQIPRDRVVQLLTTEMNYDPWGGNDDYQPIDWKSLKVTAKTTPLAVPGAKNKWHLDNVDLGATCGAKSGARGVFLADVSSNEVVPDNDRPWLTPRSHRVLANVTDMGVMIKVGPASGLVWVTSLTTGDPIVGAKVVVSTPEGEQRWVDATDAQGLIRIPGSALLKKQPSADDAGGADEDGWSDWDSYRSQRMIATVEKDGDLAVVDGNWANGIQIWNFGLPEERRGGATRIRGFIESDRGLYRPGESVHFKGFVRELAANKPPRVPDKQPIAVEVEDSRGQTVLDTQVAMTSFGGFTFDLGLSEDARLGDYYVSAKVGGQTFRERFIVEEFRPAAFELGMKSDAKQIHPGDRMAMTLDAKYLFGSPVADAKVEWNARRRKHSLRFPGYDEFSFDTSNSWWWWGEREDDYGTYLTDGEGTTDARGRFAFAVRDPANDLDGPQDYIVSANVTDGSDQTIGKSVIIAAHKNDFYLGLHANEFVQAVGMPFGANLVAVDPDGKRVAAKATFSFIRTVNDCNWSDMGARSYQSCKSHEEIAMQVPVDIAATGMTMQRIYPKKPGDYVVKLESTDAHGNKIVASSEIWVIGKGEAFWSGDEGDRMTLIASKQKYEPGETARLVAQANLKHPTALVTIERDGILDAFVKKLDSAGEGVEIGIKDAWAPNVFASVAMVQGRIGDGDRNRPLFKMGVVELKVSSEHKRLDVAIHLDKDHVRPGDKVTGSIDVTSSGQPVKAELALSVADEGVLQLIAYQTPDPMKTFYATWGLGVDTGTNWNRVARLADPASGDPDEGGDSGGGDDGQRVRSRFVSSAYWAPALVTDEHGHVTFTFTAPDNLTAFRLMAAAADVSDRFGSGELRLTVSKPLMAQPALPRFLDAGDTASVGVVIHNNTDKAGTATVTAKAIGVVLTSSSQQVDVPANGSARVRFAATASENAAATFEFGVAMNGERDALKVTLPVRRPRIFDTKTLAEGRLDPNKATSIAFTPTSSAIPNESELVITVDRAGLGELEPSLRYLVTYPYGCLEQTLSRFIPLVEAKDLARSLDLESLPANKVDAFLEAGVAKVARHQQGDGHFSLWPQSQTYPQLTVYAMWGLREAKKAGVAVPADTMTRGMKALTDWVHGGGPLKPDGDGATAAMTAYLLASDGHADAGLDAKLYELRAGLPKWGLSFLLRALVAAKADSKMIDEVRARLLSGLEDDGTVAFLREGRSDDFFYMNSDVRATAMALDALIEVSPKDPLVERLAAGLKKHREPTGAWGSTQENLWALVALADYARQATAGDADVTIEAGGKTLSHKHLTGGEVDLVRMPIDHVSGGAVRISASGALHYSARLIEAKRDDQAAKKAGVSIAREYFDEKGNAITKVAVGSIVVVRLTVDVDADRRWIALVDPLPAGLEPLNLKLAATVDTSAHPLTNAVSGRSSWSWDYQEMRDDEVRWFADYLPRGTYVLTYKARATIDGAFVVPSAHVEAMYDASVSGRTAAGKLTVTK